ncbi:MAG: hypothetical protein JWP89_4667 [Schlesneria sp.]|nr:hypothetical protein [Schlesneria sp.]
MKKKAGFGCDSSLFAIETRVSFDDVHVLKLETELYEPPLQELAAHFRSRASDTFLRPSNPLDSKPGRRRHDFCRYH